ncbi:hypothetical protein GQ53DRAFT_428072 [Thozetella sp. PMI_491]|nr:hypothetical protein GQ53DRAFT_428072 [Thozetella sp. PMI_491]
MSLSVTKGLAIASSFTSGGAIAAATILVVPALLSAPHNIAVKQFKLIHAIGRLTQTPATLVAALLHGFVAYRARDLGSGAWSRWATSAALTAAVVPWSLALVEPVNGQLLAIAGTGDKREGGTEISEKTEVLLRRWNVLNVFRAGFAFAAGGVSLWTVLAE